MFEIEDSYSPSARIKVVGVGGAGGNAVDHMIDAGIQGVEFIAVNTDLQALSKKKAPVKIQIGAEATGGKGAGADPEKGRVAALESRAALEEALRGADMVFIAAGMGKGTGTGAAPVVAEICRNLGILTLPVVTRPFNMEGEHRGRVAKQGLEEMERMVETVLVIPNDRILQLAGRVPLSRAYAMADDTLRHAVQSIAEVIQCEGQVNCDFNDVRAIMGRQGGIYMGVGAASGEGYAPRAMQQALTNPYLENVAVQGATGMLINVSCRDEEAFTAEDLQSILKVAKGVLDKDANFIYGLVFNPAQAEEARVTVIATGFRGAEPAHAADTAALAAESARQARSLFRGEALPTAEDLDIPTFMRRKLVAA